MGSTLVSVKNAPSGLPGLTVHGQAAGKDFYCEHLSILPIVAANTSNSMQPFSF